MKRSRFIAYSLFVLILLLAAMLLLAKKSYTFEKSILVDSSNSDVFNYIKFLKNQEQYHDWFKLDQDKMLDYHGEDGVEGARCNWRSDVISVGVGEQEIAKLKYPHDVQITMKVESPIVAVANHDIKIEDKDGKSKLTYSIQVYFRFPYNIRLLFYDFENEIEASMVKSLKNIRSAVEK